MRGDCWIWPLSTVRGYGVLWRKKGQAHSRVAHRVVYEALRGPIPEGLQLDHLCRVRACVNPWHLEPVTCQQNLLRGESFAAINAAKTHCPVGHPYDEANTYLTKRGLRHCRECVRQRNREAYRQRQRDAGIEVKERGPYKRRD